MRFDAPSYDALAAGAHASSVHTAALLPSRPGGHNMLPSGAAGAAGAAVPSAAAPRLAELAAATAPHDLNAPPESLIGRRVQRLFGEHLYGGIVTDTRATRMYGQLWRVRYDDDGDEEDLSYGELRGALLPAAAGVAHGATMTPHGTVVKEKEAERVAGASLQPTPVLSPDGSDGGAAAGAALQSDAVAAQPRYKGVRYRGDNADRRRCYDAMINARGRTQQLGCFATAVEAARAFDKAARKLGHLELNFPRPGTAEVQAVWQLSSLRGGSRGFWAHSFLSHMPSSGAPTLGPSSTPRFKGVTHMIDRCPPWRAQLSGAGVTKVIGAFDDPVQAARAYDDAVRQRGGLSVNFPRPGTAEMQALPRCGPKQMVTTPPTGMAAHSPGTPHAAAADAARVAEGGAAAQQQREPANEEDAAARNRAARYKRARTTAAEAAAAAAEPEEHHAAQQDEHLWSLPLLPLPHEAADASPVVSDEDVPPPAAGDTPAEQHAGGDGDSQLDDAAYGSPDAVAAMTAFLRGMAPPLSPAALTAALAALPGSGISVAHLAGVATHASNAAAPSALLTMLVDNAVAALHISAPGDRMAFMTALMQLAQRSDGAGGHADGGAA
jgi:hypothetical protein